LLSPSACFYQQKISKIVQKLIKNYLFKKNIFEKFWVIFDNFCNKKKHRRCNAEITAKKSTNNQSEKCQ